MPTYPYLTHIEFWVIRIKKTQRRAITLGLVRIGLIFQSNPN